MNRRGFIRIASAGTGALLCGFDHPGLSVTLKPRAAAGGEAPDGFAQGEFLGQVDFVNEGPVEMDAAFGSELDGRLYTSLSGLTGKELVTPEERFYLRTRASRILPDAATWTITVDGLAAENRENRSSGAKAPSKGWANVAAKAAPPNTPAGAARPNEVQAQHLSRGKRVITIAELRAMEKPLGLHLMECSGNTRAAHFGLISVGDWAGVPLSELLDRWEPSKAATRVLVSGFDQYVGRSVTSTPGASWIFTFEELRNAKAFLATQLDGKPLSRDHGAPIRLVVPGWYGCTCVKWVDRITFVDEAAEATSQMTEYAARTHQNGSPRLAKDFLPARIDPAAMPIRVEKWRVAGKLKYRVVGLLWGGTETVRELGIRFNPEEEYVRVDSLTAPQTTPWTLWSHAWSPATPGTYTIRLSIKDPPRQPRRLESGYYARSVEIGEV